jgi:PIN domain nuclease of toxin-antitoxin system
MKILLDTHTFIWFLEGDKVLNNKIVKAIQSNDNTNYISIASFWEIVIKSSLGKLEMKNSFDNLIRLTFENGFEILPIQLDHLKSLLSLPFHSNDPFDRIIISQAISEDMTIISKDENFGNYKVKLLW